MSIARGWFVTGTDTGVGKTLVTLALMRLLQEAGQHVAGMKPVASGCARTPEGLRNDDALRLRAQSDVQLEYAVHNPYAFAPPIAPHLAAQQAGITIDLDVIADAGAQLSAQANCLVVEGVGGWLVPLNDHATLADLAARLQLPVILVVALRLGCLNHALLSAAAIEHSGVPLAGWVANGPEPDMEAGPENIDALKSRLSAPLLGILPALSRPDINQLAHCLQLPAPGVAPVLPAHIRPGS
jgi:dethiobiotin synthetase